jgi:hypothetical protein
LADSITFAGAEVAIFADRGTVAIGDAPNEEWAVTVYLRRMEIDQVQRILRVLDESGDFRIGPLDDDRVEVR